jgi:DNA-binding transcriptional regulator YiaG
MTKSDVNLFYCGDDAPASKPYLYKECGLDNIYLMNGFDIEVENGEEFVSIRNVDGLWKAIGLNLVTRKKTLSPKEIRFLRTQMDMTQSELARLLRVDDQTVARWEKKKCNIPGPADLGLRMLFLNSKVAQPEGNKILVKLRETISNLVEEDAPVFDQMAFVRHGEAWERQRACI